MSFSSSQPSSLRSQSRSRTRNRSTTHNPAYPFNMPTLPSINSIVRWFQRKNYQYEVTFAVYMLTPTEKYIFNTLMFTLFTLGLTATYIYLPNSLIAFWQKILYYCMGEVSAASSSAAATASNMASSLANSTKEGVISLSGNMTEGLGNFLMQKGAAAAAAAAAGSGNANGAGAAAAAAAASAGQKVL